MRASDSAADDHVCVLSHVLTSPAHSIECQDSSDSVGFNSNVHTILLVCGNDPAVRLKVLFEVTLERQRDRSAKKRVRYREQCVYVCMCV